MSFEPSRRLGFGEKYCALLHEQKLGTATICVAVRVRRKLDFGAFRRAWETLFARQPMLRATLRTSGDDYELGFDARFADISLRFVQAASSAVWEREFSQDISAPLDLQRACWRASLVEVAVAPAAVESYITFSALHSIADAKSVSWLLGDLLRIVRGLERGQDVGTSSHSRVASLDDLLDRTRFAAPTPPSRDPAAPLAFQAPTALGDARCQDLFRITSADLVPRLHAQAKKHGVTLTHAIMAAFARELCVANGRSSMPFDLMTAIDFRSYTRPAAPRDLLAFYANKAMIQLNPDLDREFWQLAGEAKAAVGRALEQFQLPPATPRLFAHLLGVKDACLAAQRFFCSYVLSNVGIIDEAFSGLEGDWFPDGFYFTVSNQASLFGLSLFVATLGGKLFINYNFPSPALARPWVEALAERMLATLERAATG